MGILTNAIIQKIQDTIRSDFLPVAEQLRKEGMDDNSILKALRNYYDLKKRAFFKKTGKGADLDYLALIAKYFGDREMGSKIEGRFLYLLDRAGIKLRFQYQIGPYFADYLVDDFMVLELDGPTHATAEGVSRDMARDKFIESFGYKVLHIPTELLMVAHEAVIYEIKELIRENNEKRLNRRKRKKAA